MSTCDLRPYGAGALLKEAVDDLEWAAGSGHQAARGNVHLHLRAQPRAITMRASGAGDLEASDRALKSCKHTHCC